jgi:hypothetical protein
LAKGNIVLDKGEEREWEDQSWLVRWSPTFLRQKGADRKSVSFVPLNTLHPLIHGTSFLPPHYIYICVCVCVCVCVCAFLSQTTATISSFFFSLLFPSVWCVNRAIGNNGLNKWSEGGDHQNERVQENPVSLRSRWLQKSRVERWRTTDSALGLIKNQKVKQMGGSNQKLDQNTRAEWTTK